MNYDIIIIGGGASGLCTAIKAKNEHNSVLILEHNDRVGKKILATGNGRCNLTNANAKVDLFEFNPEGLIPYMTSGDPEFYKKVIEQFDCEDTINFFADLGMLCTDKNGYIYPRSEQASTVLDLLRYKCEFLGIDIITEYKIESIKRTKTGFSIDKTYYTSNLVVATGGLSGNSTGNDGSGYSIAKKFGHEIIDTVPALCGIKCDDLFFKALKGCRCDGKISFKSYGTDMSVAGNLQFTEYGLSGIPTFQISSLIGYMLEDGHKPVISIDFLPDISLYDVVNILYRNYEMFFKTGTMPDEKLLIGLLNKNVASVILRIFSGTTTSSQMNTDAICLRLAKLIKMLEVHPVSLMNFENAQTTAGGVFTGQINPESMESNLEEGLFFVGEVLDVNGICGGYNLQWAFSTAAICGKFLNELTACDIN